MTNDTQISEREREILCLVATGATNQQIAQRLNISINTVKVHLRNIFGKIGAVSRTEATVYAIRNGLVPELAAGELPAPVQPAPPGEALAEAPGPAAALPAVAAPTLAVPAEPAPAPRRTRLPLLWLGGGLVALLVAVGLLWPRFGGVPAGSPTAATAAALGGEASRWSTHAPLPRPREHFALAAFEPGGRLFVIGGSAGGRSVALVDSYDPQSGRWDALADKPTAVSGAGAISLRGKIYVPGGEGEDGQPMAILEAYDPQLGSWQQLEPMPAPRSRYALAAWEGRIYLFGGRDGANLSEEVFVYDPVGDRWSRAAALPSPRQSASATVVSGRLYLVGGEDAAGPLSEMLRLDPGDADGGRWVRLQQLPMAVAVPSAITVINSLLVVDAADRAAWQYDAGADTWAAYPIAEGAIVAPAAALLSTSIFFVADGAAPSPGVVGEYVAFFTTFVPSRGGPPASP